MEITISLSDSLFEAVSVAARHMGISQGEFCERAITRFVEHQNAGAVRDVLDIVYGAVDDSALDPLIEAAGSQTQFDENW